MDRGKIGIDSITSHIRTSIEVKQKILQDPELISKIDAVSDLCVDAFRKGNKAILAGNGGSAADAQHIAAEFVSRFRFDRPALPSISLSTDTSMITAIGNDYGYENVFSRQLQANGREGDIFIAISTSGNSPNIIDSIHSAKKLGITSVALTGASGGKMKDISDHVICVPCNSTEFIQESHIMIGHIICGHVENIIFGKN